MKTGIYKITIEDQIYVGSSKQIEYRWKQHKLYIKKGICNYKIRKAYKGSALFEVLEECECSLLEEREQYYIDKLKPTLNIATEAYRAPGYSRAFSIKDPFGDVFEFNSLKECPLASCSVSELLDEKRNHVEGWVRVDYDHTKVPRRGLISPDGEKVYITNIRTFCKEKELPYYGISDVLWGKATAKHCRGWRLPEHIDIDHGYNIKCIKKGDNTIIFNHHTDANRLASLKMYNLRTDSLRALINGTISNHRGWILDT